MRPLESRNAVITGASRGLGLAIARAYVAAGANVLLCQTAGPLERARAELAAAAVSGQIVASRSADASSRRDVEALAAEAIRMFAQVHVLVNNAGVYGPKGALEDVDWQELGAGRGNQPAGPGLALPCVAAALQVVRIRQDHSAFGGRCDQSAAADQCLCNDQGRHRPIRRNTR